MEGIKGALINQSTNLVSLVMVIVTLVCPITIASGGGGSSTAEGSWVDLAIIAVLWTYFPVSRNSNPMSFGVEGYGLFPLNPAILFNTFPIWFLSIVFAVQVIRYYTENIPRRHVMIAGYLSLIPPTFLGLMGLVPVVQSSLILYVGPIPIQFLVGYAFVRFSHKLKTGIDSDQELTDSWLEEEGKD